MLKLPVAPAANGIVSGELPGQLTTTVSGPIVQFLTVPAKATCEPGYWTWGPHNDSCTHGGYCADETPAMREMANPLARSARRNPMGRMSATLRSLFDTRAR